MVDREILITSGRFYSKSLSELFAQAGLNLAALVQEGCLCFDVGEGPEIPAFAPFESRTFIATEPPACLNDLNPDINRSLEETAAVFPEVKLYRSHVFDLLEQLSGTGEKFGLITHFNLFPPKFSRRYVENFFQKTADLLVPGGVSIMSLTQDPTRDESIGVSLYTGGYPTLRELGFGVFDVLPSRWLPSGGLFLGGIKP